MTNLTLLLVIVLAKGAFTQANGSTVENESTFLSRPFLGARFASHESARGAIVYGTVVRPFAEYLVENHRRNQWLRQRPDPAKLEVDVRRIQRLFYHLLIEKQSINDVLRKHPELTDMANHVYRGEVGLLYGLRNVEYFREVHDQNVAAVWAELGMPVLALVGEYEIRTTAFDHQYLADIVNFHHPGNGTFKQIPRMDHGFALHTSLADAVKNEFQGPFGHQLVLEATGWMRSVMEDGDG